MFGQCGVLHCVWLTVHNVQFIRCGQSLVKTFFLVHLVKIKQCLSCRLVCVYVQQSDQATTTNIMCPLRWNRSSVLFCISILNITTPSPGGFRCQLAVRLCFTNRVSIIAVLFFFFFFFLLYIYDPTMCRPTIKFSMAIHTDTYNKQQTHTFSTSYYDLYGCFALLLNLLNRFEFTLHQKHIESSLSGISN